MSDRIIKPKKREVYEPTDKEIGDGAFYALKEIKGYNKAIDNYEEFLPDLKGIKKIIKDYRKDLMTRKQQLGLDWEFNIEGIAEAIHNRITKGE